MARIVPALIMALSATAALQVQALQLLSPSAQGEVAQLRLVVARFDRAAVNFGDPKAPAPLALQCSNAQVAKALLVGFNVLVDDACRVSGGGGSPEMNTQLGSMALWQPATPVEINCAPQKIIHSPSAPEPLASSASGDKPK